MRRDSCIYVAGHRGMAGSAMVRALQAAGYSKVLLRTSQELDLTEQAPTRAFFERERPEYVIDCAAKVGGIVANNTLPADFIQKNLAIQTNVLHEAWRAGAKRVLMLGSSCVYPRDCPQPMKEEHLMTGPLEATNRPYAMAKLAGIEMCWAYNRQYGTRFASPMPTNLYGPNDNYHPENSHVVAALLRKFYEAKKQKAVFVTAWGSGTPRREFLHVDDMAAACLLLMSLSDADWDAMFPVSRAPIVNVGIGTDMSIRELADAIQKALGSVVNVDWDQTRPDGTPRKLMDSSRMLSTGWKPAVRFEDGLRALVPELERRLGS